MRGTSQGQGGMTPGSVRPFRSTSRIKQVGIFYKKTIITKIFQIGKRILTVSGGPRNFSTFDLEPVRGDEDRAINIKIKKGPKDFKVGLTTKSSSDAAGNPIYVANMYIVPPGIKRIEIEDFEIEDTKDQGHKVTAIMANGDRTNVGLDKTKTFRVVDKYYWRDTLTKGQLENMTFPELINIS